MKKKIVAGVLVAVMAASNSIIGMADTMAAGAGMTNQRNTVDVQTIAPGEQSQEPAVTAPETEPQTAGGPQETGNTQTETSSAAVIEAPSETTGAAVIEAPSETTGAAVIEMPVRTETAETAASPVVGSGTAGSETSATGGSRVVGPGIGSSGGPGVTGPGIGGTAGLTAGVSDGTEGFAGRVQNPVVKVAERYSYDQMEQDIQNLKSRYGSYMQVNTIGTTWDGRSLYEVVVGSPSAEKHVLIHAGIHAREYMTPLLVMKQMEYGLAFYSGGSYQNLALSDLFGRVAIHYVPMVNPDGISLSQFGINGIRSGQLRQSITQCYENDKSLGRTSAAFDRYLNYWKANGRGVDLNQNFPANWEQVTTSPLPSYATYRGESALSEPESQALVNLMNSRSWAATISYHSMGNIIYWDYSGNRVTEQSLELANLVSEKTGYRLAGSSGHGGFKDWVQIKDNPVPSLTLEVGSVACPMPVSEFSDVWNRNQEVWAAVAKYAAEH